MYPGEYQIFNVLGTIILMLSQSTTNYSSNDSIASYQCVAPSSEAPKKHSFSIESRFRKRYSLESRRRSSGCYSNFEAFSENSSFIQHQRVSGCESPRDWLKGKMLYILHIIFLGIPTKSKKFCILFTQLRCIFHQFPISSRFTWFSIKWRTGNCFKLFGNHHRSQIKLNNLIYREIKIYHLH